MILQTQISTIIREQNNEIPEVSFRFFTLIKHICIESFFRCYSQKSLRWAWGLRSSSFSSRSKVQWPKKLTVNPQKICTCDRHESKFMRDVNRCTSCSSDLKQLIKPLRRAVKGHIYSSILLLTQLCMLSRPL